MVELPYLRLSRYCRKYDVHYKTVIRWLRGGQLEGFHVGRNWRVRDARPTDAVDSSTIASRFRRHDTE